MAAIVEVKYFNSFWLKKVVKHGDTTPTWPGLPWVTATPSDAYGYFTLTISTLGTGYGGLVGFDVETTSTNTGQGLIVNITSVNGAGGITGITMVSAGTNFVNGNTVIVPGGSGTGEIRINTIPFPFGASGSAGTPLTGDQNFYIEEPRVKGGFNNTITDLGVRAYSINENQDKTDRTFSLIFSGIYNTRSGYNETNVFSVSEAIIKDADPINGSIQKLYTEDTNLLIFQENKVSKSLINKSTIYSGDQGATETLGIPQVIGQLIPYLGEYGISKNPESFAIYGYRKYFTDKNRAAVLRLSRDGITEISSYGMRDYFRDYLSTLSNEYKPTAVYKPLTTSAGAGVVTLTVTSASCCDIEIGAEVGLNNSTTNVATTTSSVVTNVVDAGSTCTVTISPSITIAAGDDEAIFITYRKDEASGGWDIHNQNYVLSLKTSPYNISDDATSYSTASFDEHINGWTSFYSYKPTFLGSLKNKYYTFVKSNIYEHYDSTSGKNRGNFYGTSADSSITFIFNPNPVVTKNFNTIAYEGANGWEADYVRSDYEGFDPDVPFATSFTYTASNQYRDTTNPVKSYDEGKYTINGLSDHVGFDRKENKYVTNLVSSSTARPGEVIFGSQVSGIKGYVATVKLSTDSTTDPGGEKELFSASSNYVLSSR